MQDFNSDSVPFFSGFLDKLKAVMDPGLVETIENPPGQQGGVAVSGITFFSTLFRWVIQGQERDCNVCMPFNTEGMYRAHARGTEAPHTAIHR